MYYQRKLEHTILAYLDKPEILAVVGPRQSGKTTLLKKIQSDTKASIWLDFEDQQDLQLFDTDIKGFAKKYFDNYKYIFIDEFQYSRRGGKNLKYLYDSYPQNKIIISGSSAIDLTIQAIKFLVGRVLVFSLYQLDFEEFLNFKQSDLIKIYSEYKSGVNWKTGQVKPPTVSAALNEQFNQLLSEFIVWGGYPRVAIARQPSEKEIILKNIYNTYFLRDIKDALGLIDDFKLANLIKALSLQIGQLVEYNELGQVSGYDYLSLKKYLNILEKTFICLPLRPFFQNKRKEIVKNPKLFFFDTGLRNYVIGDFKDLSSRNDVGGLYENFVFNQLIKQDIPINFWRNKTGTEVDFVLGTDGDRVGLEVKTNQKPASAAGLNKFMNEYQTKYGIVLSKQFKQSHSQAPRPVYFLPHWLV